jgi:hypothetical protein
VPVGLRPGGARPRPAGVRAGAVAGVERRRPAPPTRQLRVEGNWRPAPSRPHARDDGGLGPWLQPAGGWIRGLQLASWAGGVAPQLH